MRGKGIPEAGCTVEKDRVMVVSTISKKLNGEGVLLGTASGYTSGN